MSSTTLSAAEQVTQFMGAIADADDIVEIRCVNRSLPEGHARKVQSQWCKASEVVDRVGPLTTTNQAGFDIYVSPNAKAAYGARGDAGVKHARCLFADFDGNVTLDDVMGRIALAMFPHPSVIVATTHGYHVYWPFDEPTTDLTHWRELQKDLAFTLQSDAKIHNPERVMRLPGFVNWKTPTGTAELIEADASRIYGWADVVSCIRSRPTDATSTTPTPDAPTGSNSGMRVKATIAMLSLNMTDGNDGSGRLYACACRAVEHNLSDADAISAIRAVEAVKPFPKPWTDAQILKRVRDAEKVAERGDVPEPDADPGAADEAATGYVPMPVDEVFPPPVARFINEGAKAQQIDPAFIAVPLVAALGSAAGNAVRVVLKNKFHQPPVLWNVIVAYSGSGKSPAQSLALEPVWTRQTAALHTFRNAMADYKEAMAEYESLTKAERTHAVEPEPPTLAHNVIDNTTVEAIAKILDTNPRGLLCAPDELNGLLKSLNQYKKNGSDKEGLLTMYDAKPTKVDRKGSLMGTILIPSAALSICGTIQPSVLASTLASDDSFTDSGFAARMVFVQPPEHRNRQWNEDAIDDATVHAVERVFNRLYDLPLNVNDKGVPTPRYLPLTQDAKAIWAAWFNEVEAEIHGLADPESPYATALPKLRSLAARLALILQLTSYASGEKGADWIAVDATSMRRGVTLARWFKHEQSRVYASLCETKESRRLRRLISIIRQSPFNGSVTVREWQRKTSAKRVSAELDLNQLVEAGIAEWGFDKGPKTGGHNAKRLTLKDTRPAADSASRASVSQPSSEDEDGSPSSSTDTDSQSSNYRQTDARPDLDTRKRASVSKGAA